MELTVAIIGAIGAILAAILPPIIEAYLKRQQDSRGVSGVRLIAFPVYAAFGLAQVIFLLSAEGWIFVAQTTGSDSEPPRTLFFIEVLLLSSIAGILFGYYSRQRHSLLGASTGYVGGIAAAFFVLQIFLLGGADDFSPGCFAFLAQGVLCILVVLGVWLTLRSFRVPRSTN